MSWVAAGITAGAIGGSFLQSGATKDAARMQADAANRAAELQYKMYQQQREDLAPWRAAGSKALTELGSSDFQTDFNIGNMGTDPGYEFRMREGQKALERSAAAKGGLQSGGLLKALSRYGQDYASNEYANAYNRFNADKDRRFNRLSSIAGLGQTANSQIATAGQNYANQVGSGLMGAANTIGAANIANANIWGRGISDTAGAWMSKLGQSQGNSISPSYSSSMLNGDPSLGTYSGGRTYGLLGRV